MIAIILNLLNIYSNPRQFNLNEFSSLRQVGVKDILFKPNMEYVFNALSFVLRYSHCFIQIITVQHIKNI